MPGDEIVKRIKIIPEIDLSRIEDSLERVFRNKSYMLDVSLRVDGQPLDQMSSRIQQQLGNARFAMGQGAGGPIGYAAGAGAAQFGLHMGGYLAGQQPGFQGSLQQMIQQKMQGSSATQAANLQGMLPGAKAFDTMLQNLNKTLGKFEDQIKKATTEQERQALSEKSARVQMQKQGVQAQMQAIASEIGEVTSEPSMLQKLKNTISAGAAVAMADRLMAIPQMQAQARAATGTFAGGQIGAVRGLGVGDIAGRLSATGMEQAETQGTMAAGRTLLGMGAGGAAAGAAIGAGFLGIGAVPGAIIGGAIGVGYGLFSGAAETARSTAMQRAMGMKAEEFEPVNQLIQARLGFAGQASAIGAEFGMSQKELMGAGGVMSRGGSAMRLANRLNMTMEDLAPILAGGGQFGGGGDTERGLNAGMRAATLGAQTGMGGEAVMQMMRGLAGSTGGGENVAQEVLTRAVARGFDTATLTRQIAQSSVATARAIGQGMGAVGGGMTDILAEALVPVVGRDAAAEAAAPFSQGLRAQQTTKSGFAGIINMMEAQKQANIFGKGKGGVEKSLFASAISEMGIEELQEFGKRTGIDLDYKEIFKNKVWGNIGMYANASPGLRSWADRLKSGEITLEEVPAFERQALAKAASQKSGKTGEAAQRYGEAAIQLAMSADEWDVEKWKKIEKEGEKKIEDVGEDRINYENKIIESTKSLGEAMIATSEAAKKALDIYDPLIKGDRLEKLEALAKNEASLEITTGLVDEAMKGLLVTLLEANADKSLWSIAKAQLEEEYEKTGGKSGIKPGIRINPKQIRQIEERMETIRDGGKGK